MLPFRVEFKPGVPPYEAVVFAVKKAVASGALGAGDALPSVRVMSRELKLNPNTCQKAVAALTAEGMLEIRPGVGTVLTGGRQLEEDEALGELAGEVEALVIEAQRRGLSEAALKRELSRHWKDLRSEEKAKPKAIKKGNN
jgi:GntR family transcriptional regulator